MSWLFGSNEFNEVIEKATSEMIPAGQEDISLFLEICDRIRGKEIGAKDAMRSLKKRLLHRNPNVQLLALQLTDICVKNAGSLFLAEVASREFMDTLVQLVNNNSTNHEVKAKILGHIQSWSNAFKSKPSLSYAVDTFNQLKSQGHKFPAAVQKTDAIMIDTQEAPEWTDSEVCERCRVLFTLTNRKHHCRNCGKTFCGQCTRNNVALPRLGINKEVRVCDGCFASVQGRSEPQTPVTPLSLSFTGGNSGSQSKEEEELQRAIALSILEAEKKKPQPQQRISSRPNNNGKDRSNSEEDDPELAAAIAASLKEVNVGKDDSDSIEDDSNRRPSYYPSAAVASGTSSSSSKSPPFTASYSQVASKATVLQQHPPPQPQQNGLSQTEVQSIGLFHQLMDKMDADPTGTSSSGIVQDMELKMLHESMMKMHPKLVKDIEECVEKHKNLMELHEKLSGAVRTYDRLYETRLAAIRQQQQQQQQQHAHAYSAYAQPAYFPPPPQQQYGSPPVHHQVATPAGYPYQTAGSAPPPQQPPASAYPPPTQSYYGAYPAAPAPSAAAASVPPSHYPPHHHHQPPPPHQPQQQPYYNGGGRQSPAPANPPVAQKPAEPEPPINQEPLIEF